MKKIFLILFLLVIVSKVYCQYELNAGTYTVGGNISFSNDALEGEDNSLTYFSFSPNVGYFFWENLYTGLNLSYQSNSSGDQSNKTYGIGPSIRYYFLKDNLKPFLGAHFNFQSGYDNGENTYKGTTYSLLGGVDYFITEYFAIEAAMQYSKESSKHYFDNYSYENKIRSISLYIGANYFIK